MRAVVSVGGTWHAPHLAYQLQRLGWLEQVITTTPLHRFTYRADIEPKRMRWFPLPELFGARLPAQLRIPASIYQGSLYWQAVSFDAYVAFAIRHLQPDLLIGFSRYSLKSFQVCKTQGILSVNERGNTHTLFRERILAEEYVRLGIAHLYKPLDPRIIEREVAEYALADRIAVASRFVENSFLEMGTPPEKIIRVPYGVDLNRFKQAPTSKMKKGLVVLSVGNLGVVKGTKYLLSAVEKLKGLDIQLRLAGTLDSYIKGEISRAEQPIEFVGHIQQADLPMVYSNASVYCLPSIEEGMSMTILEAMACGLPVIASTNTGAADIITDGVDGFLVPIHDPEAIAEKLKILCDQPAFRAEMGRKAHERVALLTWDHYGQAIVQSYQNKAV